jgi:AcrR family transcriptional regulator
MDRRGEVLQAAAATFSKKGYSAASLKDVGDAAGVLPGSLYHHFVSKEDIAVSLLEDLDRDVEALATAVSEWLGLEDTGILQRLRTFAEQVAEVAVAHRAAVQLRMYDAPRSAGRSFSEAVTSRGRLMGAAGLLFSAAARAGEVADDPRLIEAAARLLPLKIIQGVGENQSDEPSSVARAVCSIILDGLLVDRTELHAMDESIIVTAPPRTADASDRREHLLETAKDEFARHGYESTTMRDLSLASGIPAGAVYRIIGSKANLLAIIMNEYDDTLQAAVRRVDPSSSPLKRIENLVVALSEATSHFDRESRVIQAWMRFGTLDPVALLPGIPARRAVIREVLEDGIRDGVFRRIDTLDRQTGFVRDLLFTRASELGSSSIGDAQWTLRHLILNGVARLRD